MNKAYLFLAVIMCCLTEARADTNVEQTQGGMIASGGRAARQTAAVPQFIYGDVNGRNPKYRAYSS